MSSDPRYAREVHTATGLTVTHDARDMIVVYGLLRARGLRHHGVELAPLDPLVTLAVAIVSAVDCPEGVLLVHRALLLVERLLKGEADREHVRRVEEACANSALGICQAMIREGKNPRSVYVAAYFGSVSIIGQLLDTKNPEDGQQAANLVCALIRGLEEHLTGVDILDLTRKHLGIHLFNALMAHADSLGITLSSNPTTPKAIGP